MWIRMKRKESRCFARAVIRFSGFAAVGELLLFHLSGCGGAAPVPQTVTPIGTNTITVTGSSGGVTPQTKQLALTIH
jgi:hypothetical protein